MPDIFFENKATGKRYQLLSRDTEKGTVTLKGPHGTFIEPYDKERFKKLGYELVQA